MPSVLIYADDTSGELPQTLLWRDGVARTMARRQDDALALASNHQFDLIVVDRELPGAVELVRALRSEAATRAHSIAVVMASREFEPQDLELIEAGANAILRPPADEIWDQRLAALMRVPLRRTGRFPVELKIELMAGVRGVVGGTVLNLSEHGMLLETETAMALGADVDFWIYLQDEVTPLRGCGQVIRQDAPRRGGVRFFALESDGLARLRRFVQA